MLRDAFARSATPPSNLMLTLVNGALRSDSIQLMLKTERGQLECQSRISRGSKRTGERCLVRREKEKAATLVMLQPSTPAREPTA